MLPASCVPTSVKDRKRKPFLVFSAFSFLKSFSSFGFNQPMLKVAVYFSIFLSKCTQVIGEPLAFNLDSLL